MGPFIFSRKKLPLLRKGGAAMKGYYTDSAYYGRLPDGSWRRFETEAAYIEYYRELMELMEE